MAHSCTLAVVMPGCGDGYYENTREDMDIEVTGGVLN